MSDECVLPLLSNIFLYTVCYHSRSDITIPPLLSLLTQKFHPFRSKLHRITTQIFSTANTTPQTIKHHIISRLRGRDPMDRSSSTSRSRPKAMEESKPSLWSSLHAFILVAFLGLIIILLIWKIIALVVLILQNLVFR